MESIGEVVTQSQLKSLQRWNEQSIPTKGYIAPTVYRLASSTSLKWPYFSSLQSAVSFIKVLARIKGAVLPPPAGYTYFTSNKTAQTLGINVDFYWPVDFFGTLPVPYVFVRDKFKAGGNVIMPFKFYKTNGSGPFYSVLSSTDLNIAATVSDKLSPDKIQQLDKLTREVVLLKANYNALATFISKLGQQQLLPVQQQVFNEGILRLLEYKQQIAEIKDIEFKFGKSNQVAGIGNPAAVIWLVFWAVTAIIAAYTVTRIAAKWAEVQKIRSDNDAIEFITDANIRIAKDASLTAEQKRDLINENNKTKSSIEQHKTTVEENAAKPAIIEQVIGLAKWGVIFYGIKIIGEKISKN
jgi:hypothetical protein